MANLFYLNYLLISTTHKKATSGVACYKPPQRSSEARKGRRTIMRRPFPKGERWKKLIIQVRAKIDYLQATPEVDHPSTVNPESVTRPANIAAGITPAQILPYLR